MALGVRKRREVGELGSRKSERSTSFGIVLIGEIGVYGDGDKRMEHL